MSQAEEPTEPQSSPGAQDAPPTLTGMAAVMDHMKTHKIEAALWSTRVMTVIFTFFFVLPIFNVNPYSCYQKALISSAITSALRLHQRLPHVQLSREFLATMFLEDSCHYLFYSLILLACYPVTMALIPIFLYALLHATTFTKVLLDKLNPNSLMILRNLIAKLEAKQREVLRFIACTEIFMMPTSVFMIFTGRTSLLFPFLYYRFLSLRYASRRNPYCRQLFYELRVTVEYYISRPSCPAVVNTYAHKAIAFISRLAPATQPSQPAQ